MIGHDVGELLQVPEASNLRTLSMMRVQVLDERAREFNPFITRAADIAMAAVKSTRGGFDPTNDMHLQLLRRIWSSAMKEQPFPGHEHADWEHQIGFQSKTPGTDLKKLGVFALEQLAYSPHHAARRTHILNVVCYRYFAEHYTERFDGIRRFGTDSEFPASTISVYISDLILTLLNCSIGPVSQAAAAKGAALCSVVLVKTKFSSYNLTAAISVGTSKTTAKEVGAAVTALMDCAPMPRSYVLSPFGAFPDFLTAENPSPGSF
jgi:hypothetical protein